MPSHPRDPSSVVVVVLLSSAPLRRLTACRIHLHSSGARRIVLQSPKRTYRGHVPTSLWHRSWNGASRNRCANRKTRLYPGCPSKCFRRARTLPGLVATTTPRGTRREERGRPCINSANASACHRRAMWRRHQALAYMPRKPFIGHTTQRPRASHSARGPTVEIPLPTRRQKRLWFPAPVITTPLQVAL